MKILQVSSAMSLGGGEVHVIDLCCALLERGHEVHLAVRPQSPLMDHLASLPVRIHQLPLRNSLDIGSARRMSHLIRHYETDIIHGHVARDYLVCALAQKLARRGQLVLTRHHYLPIKRKWGHQRLFRRAGKIIAVSEFVRINLITSLNLPPQQVVTIPNWVNLDGYRELPDRQRARARFGLPAQYVVGLVGQITPAKGQEEFIRAASHIASLRDDVIFLIVGKEQHRRTRFTARLRRLSSQLGLDNRLRFLDHVEDLPWLFAALTVLVIPSWFEAFSIVLIQAMAAGLPVIASNVGGPREILRHDVTGLLVPPRQVDALALAIVSLLDDPDRRARLAVAAQHVVQSRFEREKIIDQIEAVYREVLNEDRGFLSSHP